jgi:CBS-domain-containing membrane protein
VTLALLLVGELAELTHHFLFVASMAASSVLLFGFPDSAFSQPRNFIGGNLICALIGLAFTHVLGASFLTAAFATGTATAAMMMTDTLHPPAAANPLIIFSLHAGWSYVLFPTLCGDLVVLGVALLYHYLTRKERYPHYWF